MNVAILHPNLGIGGAERLIVDAAVQLQGAGHRVTIFTNHHDRARCFEATRDGTLAVRVYGDFLPSHVGQHLRAPGAIVRMLYLGCAAAWHGPFDVILCDLVAHVIPALKLLARVPVVFYCHFPDQLLVTRERRLYGLYRLPIDRLEEWAMGYADRVLVNSAFTATMFRRAFPRLHKVTPEVLYPGVDMPRDGAAKIREHTSGSGAAGDEVMLLTIGRYDRSKNVVLAIEALAQLRARLPVGLSQRVRLVVAGSYDERSPDNVDTMRQLVSATQRLGLVATVVFLRSPSDTERVALLARCRCLVHTMPNEHFGLAPLEAMAAAKPVVAVNSGGVRETVRHEETGLLCEPTADAMADALARLVLDRDEAARLGEAARLHVQERFSLAAFGERLDSVMREVGAKRAGTARGSQCSAA